MEVPTSRNPKTRTACDTCYRLKERCQRATISAPCARCERLGLKCLTVRPVRPAGRKILHGKNMTSRKSPRKTPAKISRQCSPLLETDICSDTLPDLDSEEKELLLFLTSQRESQDHFFLFSSSGVEQKESLASQLPAVSPLLKDVYLACAMTIKQLQAGSISNTDMSTCVRYVSKAMRTLRTLPVSTPQDAAFCNTLGGILSFSVHSAIGVGVPDICSFCLSITAPIMETQMSDGRHDDPWQGYLVLLEVADCLVYRRKPTRTIQTPAPAVDLRLGLCVPLLVYYHDLAVISNSLLSTTDLEILSRLQKQLDVIHTLVGSWQPSHSDQILDQFQATEIVNLLAQAKVYRLGALLVGHRLQYPFGSNDVQAGIWSKEAMMELEMAKRVTKRPLRFVTLPFIVAAVEVRDEGSRLKTLQIVDDYVDYYAPFLRTATKIFLSRVWHERDMHVTTRWFDSIHKPCPVMDSIDATCFTVS